MMTTSTRPLVVSALIYARAGIAVFPCAPGQKHPLVERGLYAASTDLDQIRDWWRAHPAANIAIPTGHPHWDVVDVDVKNGAGGFATLGRLHAAGLVRGASHIVGTPSGGLHLYFAGTYQRNGSLPRHGIDFRGTGGYVLAPPSAITIHGGLRPYRTLGIRHVGVALRVDWQAIRYHMSPPAPEPRPQIVPTGDPSRRMGYLIRHIETRPEGTRHNSLLWAAHRAVDDGSSDLTPLISAAVRAGLDEREARGVIAHVVRHRLLPAHRDGAIKGYIAQTI